MQLFAGIFLMLALFFLFLSSCTTPTAPRAKAIICHTAYRSGTGVPIEEEETVTFEDSDADASTPFSELTFHAAYSTGTSNRERSLRLWVTGNDSGMELFRQLYQLPLDSGPTDQFIGGHGFTGLNYAYHPQSGAELQYWCTAE
jgi:hypothetical protein